MTNESMSHAEALAYIRNTDPEDCGLEEMARWLSEASAASASSSGAA